MQYINTLLLGLLTLSVSVGAFQLSALNDKYITSISKQSVLEERINTLMNIEVKQTTDIFVIQEQNRDYSNRILYLEAILRDKKYYFKPLNK